MLQNFFRSITKFALVAVAVGFIATPAVAQSDQQKLLAASDTALSNFLRDPEMKWLQQNFGRAKAVMIAPEIVKAGFIFGGSGGRALVVARDAEVGKWVGPAFYTMATASVGFQAGVSVSEDVTLVMTDKGFNSLLATSFKMGGDASVAAGPVGAGAKSRRRRRPDHVQPRQGRVRRPQPRRHRRRPLPTTGTRRTTARRCCRRTSWSAAT